jgi:hypothetical protein
MSDTSESKSESKSERVWTGHSATKIVILVLLLMILYYVVPVRKNEHFGFRGQSYSAGASQRILGTEFSSTDQKPYEAGYNSQILNQLPGVESSQQEHFSSISGEKKRAQTRGPLKQEEILANQLYSEHFTSPDDIVKRELSTAREFSA